MQLTKRITVLCLTVAACAVLGWMGSALIGCSGNSEDHAEAPGESAPSPHQAAVASFKALLASPDLAVFDARTKTALAPEVRQQLVDVVQGSTVEEGGIRPGEADDPPVPPPFPFLYVLPATASADQIAQERALACIEVYGVFGFAQIVQPGKPAFLLNSDKWEELTRSSAELPASNHGDN